MRDSGSLQNNDPGSKVADEGPQLLLSRVRNVQAVENPCNS